MTHSVVLANADPIAAVVDLAQRAEAAGFDRVWTTENHSRDGVLRAAAIALATRTIGVGTGIAYAFTRAPLAMAALTAEVQTLCGGRFTLGLGAMTRGMRRNWYGLELDHPAPRLREYIELVRAALRADRGFSFHGRFYHADVPAFELIGDHALIASTPIYGSGVNAVMLKTCAKICDGVALHSIASGLPYYDTTVAAALTGAKARVAVWRITSIDADANTARAAARRHIAFYLTTPSYRSVAEGRPWAERVDAIQTMFRENPHEPDWERIVSLVSDEMLDELALAGSPAQVRERAADEQAEYARRNVDEIVYQTTTADGDAAAGLEAQRNVIDALAPDRMSSAARA